MSARFGRKTIAVTGFVIWSCASVAVAQQRPASDSASATSQDAAREVLAASQVLQNAVQQSMNSANEAMAVAERALESADAAIVGAETAAIAPLLGDAPASGGESLECEEEEIEGGRKSPECADQDDGN